ncbi:serine hydrolase domain-containing protein [Marisediminicola senii]|uniref:serine hydrolase domain-containing protein n=1 Tax=Marisediminicola senii TaxID=2711233 RepID=UPI0013EBE0A0|nr:serine hydrolase [Marisediminicola senii]
MTRARILPRSTPRAEGVDAAGVSAFLRAVEARRLELHSIMLVRHGRVVAEGWWKPYSDDQPHSLFSVSKSVTATAVGFAIDEGLLTLDDRIVELLPDDLPATVGENLAALRVRHLLTMTTGHAADTVDAAHNAPDDNWARAVLAVPLEHAPGTLFVYNTGATYLLSALLTRLTGERLLDYLTPRLFMPLGITGARWERCPRGIDVGGWGLSLTTEEVAAFGQLYLQRGRWNGRQVVPGHWVDEATALQVPNGDPATPRHDAQGYGYQFWRCRGGDAYRADGAFGQFSIVFPGHDAVLAVTSGVPDGHDILDLVWEYVLPALSGEGAVGGAAAGGAALSGPAALVADDALADALLRLDLPLPAGTPTSPTAARVGGIRYQLDDGDLWGVQLTEGVGRTTITITDAAGDHHIACGFDTRLFGRTTLGTGDVTRAPGDLAIAASGAWVDATTFVARIDGYQTPFCYTVTLRFGPGAAATAVPSDAAGLGDAAGTVHLELRANASFTDTLLASQHGHAVPAMG